MKKLAVWLLCGLLVITGGNAFYVTMPAWNAVRADERNANLTMVTHLRYGVDPNTAVVDLVSIGDGSSMLDVTRALLQSAHALKDRTFSEVHLAYRGRSRFILPGSDFKQMGEEYGPQNPVYTIRTMPEKLRRPDGSRAFDTWTGGVLGVLGRQMEDVKALHMEWYLREAGYFVP